MSVLISKDEIGSLVKTANQTIEKNLRRIGDVWYLAAGSNHFNTLWTRDFCFASRGLFYLDRQDVFLSHFLSLISFQRKDGLIPRVIDSVSTRIRVSASCLGYLIPVLPTSYGLKDPLKPEYVDEHGTEAIDSNLLFVHAYFDWLIYCLTEQRDNDHELLMTLDKVIQENPGLKNRLSLDSINHENIFAVVVESLDLALQYYSDKYHQDLIQQKPFADWQDSASRAGFAFYTNCLMFLMHLKFRVLLTSFNHLEGLKKTIEKLPCPDLEKFRCPRTKLFKSILGEDFISLDGHLLLLDFQIVMKNFEQNDSERIKNNSSFIRQLNWSLEKLSLLKCEEIWQDLKPSELFNRLPGFNTVPSYPISDLSFAVRLVGLQEYHGKIYWTWLMALVLKIADRLKDQEIQEKVFQALSKSSLSVGSISEILVYDEEQQDLKEFHSWMYRSEAPFSWGAGMLAYSLLS